MKAFGYRIGALLLTFLASASCRTAGSPQIVQPGAPGEPSRVITAETATDQSQVGHTAADVQFMRDMIVHHAQALEMTALVSSRTSREDMRLLALRIDVSQSDEIEMMQSWLEVRGEQVPGRHAHHGHDATLMPGMLTVEDMARLAAATGAKFDRLFLQSMIKHHEGALIMAAELFSRPGAGQEAEIFAFASHVDADQRMEIERMGAMLKELQK